MAVEDSPQQAMAAVAGKEDRFLLARGRSYGGPLDQVAERQWKGRGQTVDGMNIAHNLQYF